MLMVGSPVRQPSMPRRTHVFPPQALIGFATRGDFLFLFAVRTFRAFSEMHWYRTGYLLPAVFPSMSLQTSECYASREAYMTYTI